LIEETVFFKKFGLEPLLDLFGEGRGILSLSERLYQPVFQQLDNIVLVNACKVLRRKLLK